MGKIKCLVCGEILESKTRHDFVMCDCENKTFVDGGEDYMRCGGVDMSQIGRFPKWESICKQETHTIKEKLTRLFKFHFKRWFH